MHKREIPVFHVGMFVYVESKFTDGVVGRIVNIEEVDGMPMCISVHVFLTDEIRHYPHYQCHRYSYKKSETRKLLRELTRGLT